MRSGSRRGATGGAVLLAVALLAACTPEPAPTPTPTGFASEAEAFAAAEATYRAYIDALNARRENPDSTPDPTDFLTGDAYNAEIESLRSFEEKGITLEGDLEAHAVRGISASSTGAIIGVCLDASGTRVINDDGEDVTPLDREDLLGLQIEVVWSAGRTYIKSTTASDDEC